MRYYPGDTLNWITVLPGEGTIGEVHEPFGCGVMWPCAPVQLVKCNDDVLFNFVQRYSSKNTEALWESSRTTGFKMVVLVTLHKRPWYNHLRAAWDSILGR